MRRHVGERRGECGANFPFLVRPGILRTFANHNTLSSLFEFGC
jgi:hypothetical protein